ncbi:NAD(P)/FAD-dependent oxidoreductase [Leucobacter albus]|uniref:NAD(P)/FAD-dependent oxidoreductase n=1 Tax=Leucobacter albus TaxID=272210 RepID=A0ABW3TMX2_9MICO
MVVGAGIVGAAIAHSLARAGHAVTVLDRGLPGAVGHRPFGALSWEETDALTREFVAEHRAGGSPMQLVTGAAALAMEPSLRSAPAAVAYAPKDAGVDPVGLTRALLESARRHGAEIRLDTPALRLTGTDGLVTGVDTPAGRIDAASVVLAAGTGAAALLATAGVRVEAALIADRPMPAGGEPLVGAANGVRGLYLAVAHPGVILSGAIGRKVVADHAWLRA